MSNENARLYKDLLESKEETLLPISDMQGDSILGFNQPCSAQILLDLVDDNAATVAGVKSWLTTTVCPNITTTLQVRQHRDQFRCTSFKDCTTSFTNVCFSYECLKMLLKGTSHECTMTQFDTTLPFCIQVNFRAWTLGDTEQVTDSWEFGAKGSNHILLNISTNSLNDMEKAKEKILKGSEKFCTEVNTTFCFRGYRGEALYGHEHFGFVDGLSEAEVRGKYETDDNGTKKLDFVVRRRVVASDDDDRYKKYSQPGFNLVDTNQFVLGYPPDQSHPYPDWCKNGSFVVYRKIAQNVPEFWKYMLGNAKDVNEKYELNLSDEKLKELAGDIAGKCVGRWWDGTPLTFDGPVTGLHYPPATDIGDKTVGKDVLNGFLFTSVVKPWEVYDDSGKVIIVKPPSQNNYKDDSNANMCPFAGHIRKMNPRDELTDVGGPDVTLKHRIIRRANNYFDFKGISIHDGHGFAFDRVKNVFQPTDDEKSHDRGLSFVAYVADIDDQFEFLLRHWANGNNVPQPGGDDFIIGQNPNNDNRDVLEIKMLPTVNLTETLKISKSERFTISRGMGYFLLPSVSTIQNVICAPAQQ